MTIERLVPIVGLKATLKLIRLQAKWEDRKAFECFASSKQEEYLDAILTADDKGFGYTV